MREFGSELEIEYARDYYFDNLCKIKEYHAFTRSGREAIGLATHSINKGVVLMPAYCCWSMEMPFENAGFTIEYYRLNEDLSADKEHIEELIRKFSPKAILVMNYFGFVPTKELVSFVKQLDNSIAIIEDFTQSLYCLPENFNTQVDFYVASIRKTIGVPDGGVILSSIPLKQNILADGSSTPFVKDHIVAGREKTNYRYSGNTDEKNAFREKQANAGKDIKENYGLYRISDEAISIIKHTIADKVRTARYFNYLHLYNEIKKLSSLKILFQPSDSNMAPFTMVVCVENRNEVQTALAKVGVYTQLLWPLKEKAKNICPNSKYMEEHMLAIPIDQRYFYDDIIEMSERIKCILK